MFTSFDVNGLTHDARYLAVHGSIEDIPLAELAGLVFNRHVKRLRATQYTPWAFFVVTGISVRWRNRSGGFLLTCGASEDA